MRLYASLLFRLSAKRLAHGAENFVLKEIGLLSNLRLMSRRFSIEVAKDYFNFAHSLLIFANGRREPPHDTTIKFLLPKVSWIARAWC